MCGWNQGDMFDRMCGRNQGEMFLAGKESRDCFDFISDLGIHGIYL